MRAFGCGSLPSFAHSTVDNVVNLQVSTCPVERAREPVTVCDPTPVFVWEASE